MVSGKFEFHYCHLKHLGMNLDHSASNNSIKMFGVFCCCFFLEGIGHKNAVLWAFNVFLKIAYTFRCIFLTNLKYFGIFRLISVFETTAMLKLSNIQYFSLAPFARFIGSLMRLI